MQFVQGFRIILAVADSVINSKINIKIMLTNYRTVSLQLIFMALCTEGNKHRNISKVIKNLVARPRPYDLYYSFHNAVMPFTLNTGKTTGFSFPSTHTICAFALATSFFKVNKKVGIVLVVLAAFVGFSRLYNYVHFPTDVIAGMLIGIAAGLLAIFIFKKFRFDDKLLRIGKGKQKS